MSPPPPPLPSPTPASRRLDALRREQAYLSQMKQTIPLVWDMVGAEILRIQGHYPDQHAQARHHLGHILPHSLQKPPPQLPPSPQIPQNSRKRIKLRVPAERWPDFNFVGRLLGPRGATLKKLERDTGCKIMIRGRGSIRKDKESEVRGKPGWEHVFNETLHVVIEVSDAIDEGDATRILTRAREMVELLLVPVPEERDTLKRQQLRDLAILNGTFRANDGPAGGLASLGPTGAPGAGSVAYQAHPARAQHMLPRDFGLAQGMHTNIEPGAPESLLARRRTAAAAAAAQTGAPGGHNPINFTSGGAARASPAGPLARHNSLVDHHHEGAYAAGRHHAAASSAHDLHAKRPARSESYLPDIGSLHIPSLEIETMSESFLVSPVMGHHGLPGPSPTIVDPEMYPFPSTPSVLTEHPAGFGSPIWGGPSQSAGVMLPGSSPQPVGSSPLPSPPARSPPAEGATGGGPALSAALPAIILSNKTPAGSPVGATQSQKFGFGMVDKAPVFPGGRGGREQRKRGPGLFDVERQGEPAGGDERFGGSAFANFFPKVTGGQGQNGTAGDDGAKNNR